jgi:hypothetical protein
VNQKYYDLKDSELTRIHMHTDTVSPQTQCAAIWEVVQGILGSDTNTYLTGEHLLKSLSHALTASSYGRCLPARLHPDEFFDEAALFWFETTKASSSVGHQSSPDSEKYHEMSKFEMALQSASRGRCFFHRGWRIYGTETAGDE